MVVEKLSFCVAYADVILEIDYLPLNKILHRVPLNVKLLGNRTWVLSH